MSLIFFIENIIKNKFLGTDNLCLVSERMKNNSGTIYYKQICNYTRFKVAKIIKNTRH